MEWITNVIESFGYVGIFLLMLIEGLYPPIPSEIIMTLSGYFVAKENLSFFGVVIAGTAGSVLGSVIIYKIFRSMSVDSARSLIAKKGSYFFITVNGFDKATFFFNKHSKNSVLLSRLLPGVRSLISIPAGLFKMKLSTFIICTTIGTMAWTAGLASLGYYFGSNASIIQSYVSKVVYLGLLVILILVIYIVIKIRSSTKD